MSTATHTAPGGQAMTRRLRGIAHVVLAVVAATGAALSYKSLYLAAADVFDHSVLAYGFPLLVDALVLGASLQYVAGARTRSAGRHGWRATAHAGIAGTLLLNALAADTPAEVPWHIVAPAVWAVLVELYARTAAGQWKAERPDTDTIPIRLWLTAPIESARTWLCQARLTAAVAARFDTGRHTGAVEALRLTLHGRSGRRVRRVLRRQLRAGSLTPDAVLAACGWTQPGPVTRLDPTTVLRTALTSVAPSDDPPVTGMTPGSGPIPNPGVIPGHGPRPSLTSLGHVPVSGCSGDPAGDLTATGDLLFVPASPAPIPDDLSSGAVAPGGVTGRPRRPRTGSSSDRVAWAMGQPGVASVGAIRERWGVSESTAKRVRREALALTHESGDRGHDPQEVTTPEQ
ncbi:MAG: DUF2637 domain-containing protein [Actinomycetales bacterium]|nr:DUF2637 domain-containing protein [Actinomycetales bacterium]